MKVRILILIVVAVCSLLTLLVGVAMWSLPPQFQPEIVNDPDSFSFQATDIENVSGLFTYHWPNSGAQATVNHSSVTTSGSAAVVIYDPA